MQGENLAWLELAHDLGMTVDECAAKMTSTSFLLHRAYLQHRDDNPTTTQYYLMQIAQSIYASQSKKPKKILLDWFRIKFKRKKKEPLSEEEKLRQHKLIWFGHLGLDPKLLDE